MQYSEFSPKQNAQVLDEVRMGQSDLDQFITGEAAAGIKAGFEAEMCFRGLGGGSDDDMEEDMDPDERAYSIDDIRTFFHDGGYNGRRDTERLAESMYNDYQEWVYEQMSEAWGEAEHEAVKEYIEENDFDMDEVVSNYLTDELGLDEEQAEQILKIKSRDDPEYEKLAEARDHAFEVLEEKVRESIDEQDSNYENAREGWEDSQRDQYDESDWLSSVGIDHMSDVPSRFEITWPYWSGGESGNDFNESSAQQLADTMSAKLSVEVTVSSGYHGTTRKPGLWIIESDSSLEADDGDMPAEIISPPMPIDECLTKMQEYFSWAQSQDAYTNSSTGLHVGVSLPDQGGRVDYLKLALFLGDRYVLEQFDRESNTYCASALEKISANALHDPDAAKAALDQMRQGLIQMAARTIKVSSGHGKYTSINLKGDYIEFRSMGDDYIDKLPQILNTVKRYAYAMHIAGSPELHRDEYAKKLYKLLAPLGEASTIELFSKYASGGLPVSALKSFLKQAQSNRERDRTRAAAKNAENEKLYKDLGDAGFTGFADTGQSGNTGMWNIMAGGTQVFRVRAGTQGEANTLARQWLSRTSPEFRQEHAGQEFEVVPYTGGA